MRKNVVFVVMLFILTFVGIGNVCAMYEESVDYLDYPDYYIENDIIFALNNEDKTALVVCYTGHSDSTVVTIPEEVANCKVKKIRPYAFSDCSVTDIFLPHGLDIERLAIDNCKNLKRIVFKKGVSSIDKEAFPFVDISIFVEDQSYCDKFLSFPYIKSVFHVENGITYRFQNYNNSVYKKPQENWEGLYDGLKGVAEIVKFDVNDIDRVCIPRIIGDYYETVINRDIPDLKKQTTS